MFKKRPIAIERLQLFWCSLILCILDVVVQVRDVLPLSKYSTSSRSCAQNCAINCTLASQHPACTHGTHRAKHCTKNTLFHAVLCKPPVGRPVHLVGRGQDRRLREHGPAAGRRERTSGSYTAPHRPVWSPFHTRVVQSNQSGLPELKAYLL
jgi:hypothetical protein